MAGELTAATETIQRRQPEPPPEDRRHLKAIEEVLVALRRGAKDLVFYPPGHPALRKSLARLTTQVREVVEQEEQLSLTFDRDGIIHPLGTVGEANIGIKSLAAGLYLAQVRCLHIGPHFTPDELKALLALMAMSPKKVLMAGGPEAFLRAAKVRHIQVNALRFGAVGDDANRLPGGAGMGEGGKNLVEAIAPVQGQERGEGSAQSPPDVSTEAGELIGGIPEKVDPLLQVGNAPVVIDEENVSLDEILARLETAQGLDYRRLARRLDLVMRNAIAQANLDEFLRIAAVMARHRDDPARPEDLRLAASKWLQGMVEAGGLNFLVERLCQKDLSHGEAIVDLLGKLGDAAVDALLLRLSVEERMSARRRIVDAIVRHGNLALPHLLRGLQDDRWFVVRNTAIILGTLGREDALEDLAHHLRHPDQRVRRDVARAITAIGGRHAPRYLRECLSDGDPQVRQIAIAFLGSARDHLALQPLLALAERRPRDAERHEVRKAAILALGQIGNRRALPVLASLLRRRSWLFRAEPEDIRIAAANALAQMGGPEAVEALERAKASRGRLGAVCQQALARLGA